MEKIQYREWHIISITLYGSLRIIDNPKTLELAKKIPFKIFGLCSI